MKKIIIGVHGLGNKPSKPLLEKWWKDAMTEGLLSQGINKQLPKFELIYWADILYDRPLDNLEKDSKSDYFLDEPYTKAPIIDVVESHYFRQKLTDFLSEQLNNIFLNADMTLNYSFLTDMILKKYFHDLDLYYKQECQDKNDTSCKTRELIRDKLAKVIDKYRGFEIFIVAHSMGSIITYDVLNYLIPKIEINTLTTIGSPLGLPIVVSQIAAEQKLKHPGESLMITPPGISENWFNLADIRDHVAVNHKLSDDYMKNERKVSPKDFLVHNNYQINGEKNPHKSFGYLRTPEFSNILNNFIGDQTSNSPKKLLRKFQNIMQSLKN